MTGNAIAGGVLIGWTIANVPLESLGVGGWLRSLALALVAALSAAGGERGDDARHADAASVASARTGVGNATRDAAGVRMRA